MNWNTILEIGAAIVVAFGGAGAIIAGVHKIFGQSDCRQFTEKI